MRSVFLAVLAASVAACGSKEQAETSVAVDEDPYLWLEEVEGERALAWVDELNAESLGVLEASPLFETLRARNLENYNSDERIASPSIRGGFVYNFWKDANNVRGLWRRATIDDYVAGRDQWEVLLDVDALADIESEDWVYKGSDCLRPDYNRCLISLSRGGADAVVVREYDIAEGNFVENGFYLAEAKSTLSWVDRDTLYVGSDFGDGSLTESGYPRTSRLWKRGVPIEEAEEIFAGLETDVAAGIIRSWDGDRFYDFAYRAPDFFTQILELYRQGEPNVLLDIPQDARFHRFFSGKALIGLRSAWKPADVEYPQGALLAVDMDAMLAGRKEIEVLFEPTGSVAIPRNGVHVTRDFVLVAVTEDVVSQMLRFAYVDGEWQREAVDVPGPGTLSIVSTDEKSNLFFFNYEGYLTPDSLYVSDDAGQTMTVVDSQPAYFDASGMRVEQYFATSADGTRVPYFAVLPADFEFDGTAPTLIGGYGGFQVSRVPRYSSTIGHSWLERGGVYVSANIRGGGEYGPAWHRAALRENRQRAYDDFIAVAEDVVKRGISKPEHMGVRGGSNGGLLTGVMLTQRPDLYNAVVIQVPLLDMKRYDKLLAGASWVAEYGDPDTDDWEFIKAYSPYHNLDANADYPVPFITTSTRDDRVHPGHARKMAARMLEMGHDIFYFENTVGGHAGASDNTQSARNEALIYAYLWRQLQPAADTLAADAQ